MSVSKMSKWIRPLITCLINLCCSFARKKAGTNTEGTFIFAVLVLSLNSDHNTERNFKRYNKNTKLS